jgi:hypothetical protein
VRIDSYAGNDLDIGAMPHDYQLDSEWLRHHRFHVQQESLIRDGFVPGTVIVVFEVDCTSERAVLRVGIRGECIILETSIPHRAFPLIPACAIRNVSGSLTFVPARFGELAGLPKTETPEYVTYFDGSGDDAEDYPEEDHEEEDGSEGAVSASSATDEV